ncbi:Protein set-1 [Aphelenchoides avenae]|nr:Protein set-1 [Aphelenchus avenae]
MLQTIVDQKRGRRRARKSAAERRSIEEGKINHKITEYFPVRRSNRKTTKEIEYEKCQMLKKQILTQGNEPFLEVYYSEEKGRGIRSNRSFLKNEFVCEYKGEILSYEEAKEREKEYAKDAEIGSYMYFFKHRGQRYCVDATEESPFKGRLINHSALRPNLKTQVVDFNTSFHLILVAKRDIDDGEELLYDYGDRTPCTVAKNPWLVNS